MNFKDISLGHDWPDCVKVCYDRGKPRRYVPERTCRRVLCEFTGNLICSECGCGLPRALDRYVFVNYCPNCGAKVVDE